MLIMIVFGSEWFCTEALGIVKQIIVIQFVITRIIHRVLKPYLRLSSAVFGIVDNRNRTAAMLKTRTHLPVVEDAVLQLRLWIMGTLRSVDLGLG